MSANTFGLIELLLVFGLLLGFGIWQVYAVRRDQQQARKERSRRERGEPPEG